MMSIGEKTNTNTNCGGGIKDVPVLRIMMTSCLMGDLLNMICRALSYARMSARL